ncbi:MAG: hypothetical protein WAW37_04850 [Syntrophobacteraceae bacterium]
MTTIDVEPLRQRIAKLHVDRTVGDVTEKRFMREVAEATVDLYRAVIKRKLAEGEEILAEHHAISSHFRVTQSLLREPEQHATSLFLTDRRLLRLRSTVFPGQPTTADSRDATVVDEIKFDRIAGLRTRRQFRVGEAGVGAVMVVFSIIFMDFLSITSPILIGLGGLGILHTVLGPTRWIEVQTTGEATEHPIVIHTVRKKSARKLIRLLREKAGK